MILTKNGDGISAEKIVCQYRKETKAVLIRLTGGHRGLRRIIIGYPAFAVIDKEWIQ